MNYLKAKDLQAKLEDIHPVIKWTTREPALVEAICGLTAAVLLVAEILIASSEEEESQDRAEREG